MTEIIIKVICAKRWDVAATIAWRETVARGAKPPSIDSEWFNQLVSLTDHAKSRRACAQMADFVRVRHPDLAACWYLLAVDPQIRRTCMPF